MQDSIFRFVNIRLPQQKGPLEGTIDYVDPYSGGRSNTGFYEQFIKALVENGRDAARIVADDYITHKGIVSRLENLRTPLAVFNRTIASLGANADKDNVEKMICKVFDGEPKKVMIRGEFHEDRKDLADSITSAFFASSVSIPRLSHIVRGLRLCELIERVANEDLDVSAEGGIARALRATIIVPFEDGMVLQEGDHSLTVQQPLYRLWNAGGGDHFYTTSASERYDTIQKLGYVDEGIACYIYSQQVSGVVPLYRLVKAGASNHFYTTSASERDNAIQKDGYGYEGIACYIYSQQVPQATPLYHLWNAGISDHFYTTSSVERDNFMETGYDLVGIACYVLSVPINVGTIKPAGVSDLLVVRQTLRRYERGEIAHIENALKGEYMERTHRRTETTETLLLQETETITEQERDLQSTERFELKSEADKTIQENTKTQAGVTLTASYGTVNGSVSASANGQYAFDRSIEEATRTASSYAREITEQARNRVQQRTLERRSTRTVLQVEETAKHGIDNKKGKDHLVGIYRWLDKVYEAQMVNYGRRLMLEFSIPEPATYYRVLETGQQLRGLTKVEPEKPTYKKEDGTLVDLQPSHIDWDEAQELAAKYGAADIQPPPPGTETIGTTIEIPYTDKDYEKNAAKDSNGAMPSLGGSKVSSEIKITSGYKATKVEWSEGSRAYVRKDPKDSSLSLMLPSDITVCVGAKSYGSPGKESDLKLLGFTDTIPIAVITTAAGLVVTFRVECERTNEHYLEWQVKTYDAIIAAYLNQLQQYEEEVARLGTERGIQISNRPSEENRKIEQIELKRAAISILTGQHFDAFGAVYDAQSNDSSKSPRIAFSKAAIEGEIVQYFEQVFEWDNMTYIFYPYFWGRKSLWPDVLSHESTDPLFELFLHAGYARFQVPVRLNYEKMVLYFLESSKIWQEAEDAAVSKRYLPLVEEIRNQTGDDFTLGVGKVDVQKDSAEVNGNKTQFTDDDVDREIRIQSKVYRIASVRSATSIKLAKPFKGLDDPNAAYSIGPKLVGPPWEVRLPTTLVMIDKPDIVLPSWPDD